MKRLLILLTCAVMLTFGISVAQAAIVNLGQPYDVPGKNYDIYALQGITTSPTTPTNQSGPTVIQNFEFNTSIGVNYINNGVPTNWGIGVYSINPDLSTGLWVKYDSPVSTDSGFVTLIADFDIKAPKGTTPVIGVTQPVFNTGKVEPRVLVIGSNGTTILGDFGPTAMAGAMLYAGTIGEDSWNLDLADLVGNQMISGFVLYADTTSGETLPTPDPYFLVQAPTGTSVPEPTTLLLLGLGLVGVAGIRRKFKK